MADAWSSRLSIPVHVRRSAASPPSKALKNTEVDRKPVGTQEPLDRQVGLGLRAYNLGRRVSGLALRALPPSQRNTWNMGCMKAQQTPPSLEAKPEAP